MIAGSGSGLALARLLTRRYRSDVSISVPDSIGTGGAVRALVDGAIDIGVATRPLSDAERARGLVEAPIARTVLAFVVAERSSVTHVTSSDILSLLRAQKRSLLPQAPTIPFLRQRNDSVNHAIGNSSPTLYEAIGASLEAQRFPIAYTDQQMGNAVLQTEGALGIMDVGTLKLERLPIRPLRLDGSAPTVENVRLGRYPLVLPIFFVIRGDANPQVKAFVEFTVAQMRTDPALRETFLEPAGNF